MSAPAAAVAHDLVHAAFGLAGEQRDAHIERLLQVRADGIEHRQHAGDVKAADDDRDARGAQRLGDMQRARILIGLHADQADEAEIIVGPHLGDDAVDAHACIGLVDGDDVDIDVGT